MTNLDSVLKSRDITLTRKVHIIKALGFPVVMYGCECWTVTKTERQIINVFLLWCWRRLWRVPWTARRSNQSILKKSVLSIHWKDFDAEAEVLGYLMQRADSLEKTNAGDDGGQEEKRMTEDEMVEWHH